jgi:5-methylcytosine-specific restriction endonuclease McrA
MEAGHEPDQLMSPEPFVPSWLKSPSLVERSATPRATPKHGEKTRAEQFKADAKDEKQQEAVCKKAVWTRDKGCCRSCGDKVLKQLAYHPKRGETHHVVGRADWAVRFDPRNRVLVCAECHERIERGKVAIIGTARQMFTAENGKSYLNADCKLKFTEAA